MLAAVRGEVNLSVWAGTIIERFLRRISMLFRQDQAPWDTGSAEPVYSIICKLAPAVAIISEDILSIAAAVSGPWNE